MWKPGGGGIGWWFVCVCGGGGIQNGPGLVHILDKRNVYLWGGGDQDLENGGVCAGRGGGSGDHST